MRNEKELFAEAIKLWGFHAQMLMLAEESAELAVETLHMTRESRDPKVKLLRFASEIADVQFMIDQIIFALPKLKFEVDLARIGKADRLAFRIAEAKKAKEGGVKI